MPKKKQPEKIVGALASGLKVLRYLSSKRVPTGVSRIAQETGLNLSTCFNILRTLVHEELVTFDESSRAYAIGLGLAELARGALEQASYIRLIHPYLSAIVEKHAVTGTLWQRVGERVVLVDRVDHEAAIRVHMSIGQRIPMYVGALGRSMAAYSNLPKVELRKHFAALRWDNPPTFEEYWLDVERARYQGYAIDAGNSFRGVTSVAAATLDASGNPFMAISAAGFTDGFTEQRLQGLAGAVRAAAETITRVFAGGGGAPRPGPDPRITSGTRAT